MVTVMVMPRTEQLLRVSDVTVPMPAPERPLPFLKEPFAVEEEQVTDCPAVVSVTTVFPAFAVVAPPGLTVHVAAVAKAGAAAMPMTAAVAALMINALPKRLRIALTPFPYPGWLDAGDAGPITQGAWLVAIRHRRDRTFRA